MTTYAIPTSTSNPHYTQSVQLSGVTYQLELRYNTRMERWVLNIADSVGTTIVAGLVMLLNRNIASQYTTLSVPAGTLFCYSAGNNAIQPTLGSFLTDTQFLYYDPAAP